MKKKKFYRRLIFIVIESGLVALFVGVVLVKCESEDNKITLAKTLAESNFKEIAHVTNKRLFATKMLIEHYKRHHYKMNHKDSLVTLEYLMDRKNYRAQYFEAKRDWNHSLGTNPKILKYRFPQEDSLESRYDEIHNRFKAVNGLINICKQDSNLSKSCLQSILDNELQVLSDSTSTGLIDSLYIDMILAIKNNEVRP